MILLLYDFLKYSCQHWGGDDHCKPLAAIIGVESYLG